MFSNLFSSDDLTVLLEKLRQGYGPRLLKRLLSMSERGRVQRTWELTESPPKHWGSLEAVQRRWNYLATGDPAETIYDYVTREHLTDRDDRLALSLACGTGAHEIRWARTGRFANILGFDVSDRRIDAARERAEQEGIEDRVRFEVGDVRTIEMPESTYDAVLAMNALHHISPLRPTIERMARTLKPGGLVVLKDYVGPDRFQWTPRQLEAADELLRSLPIRYRIRWGSGSIKKRNHRLGRLAMMLSDPSEAAESSRILPLLDEMFEPVERKDLGGTILHIVLKDIAHHFGAGDHKADRHLDRLMSVEDELMAAGELGSDFVFGVWRKIQN